MPYTGLRVARRGPNQDDITGSERHWRLAAHRRRLRGNRLPRIFDGPPPAMRNRWVRHPTATRRELAPLTGCLGPIPAGGQCGRCDSRSFQIIIMTCANKSRETTPKALHGGGSTALGYGRLSSLVQLGGAEKPSHPQSGYRRVFETGRRQGDGSIVDGSGSVICVRSAPGHPLIWVEVEKAARHADSVGRCVEEWPDGKRFEIRSVRVLGAG